MIMSHDYPTKAKEIAYYVKRHVKYQIWNGEYNSFKKSFKRGDALFNRYIITTKQKEEGPNLM